LRHYAELAILELYKLSKKLTQGILQALEFLNVILVYSPSILLDNVPLSLILQ